jgi:hypothetical protein
VIGGGIDRQADHLDVAPVELRLELGHIAEFGGADRGEVLGWENSTAHASPIQSWNLIRPWVVSASKSGAVWLMSTDMVAVPLAIGWGGGGAADGGDSVSPMCVVYLE